MLKSLTEEVASVVEGHVGREAYADAMKAVIMRFSRKRADRKRQQAIEVLRHCGGVCLKEKL